MAPAPYAILILILRSTLINLDLTPVRRNDDDKAQSASMFRQSSHFFVFDPKTKSLEVVKQKCQHPNMPEVRLFSGPDGPPSSA